MKFKLTLMLIVVVLFSGAIYAQDTLTVSTALNSLIDEVVGDTSATGEQLHKVYYLTPGENYIIDREITVGNPLVIVSDPIDFYDADKKPPVVRIATTEDGTPSAGLFFAAGANLTLKNIYFAGLGTGQVWMDGNFVNVRADNVNLVFEGCCFDYMGWAIITNWAHPGCSYFADNVYVKNNQNPGDVNSPFWYLGIVPVDSLVARNMTYFQSHGYFVQPVSQPINYLEIDHCTFADELEMNVLSSQLTHAKITNNIYFNTQAAGQSAAENADKDFDGLSWGIVNVDTLVGNEPEAPDSVKTVTLPEADRSIVVKNNVYYWSQEVLDFWAHDSIQSVSEAVFMNARSQAMFDNDAEWPGLVAENNVNANPGFEYIGTAVADMIAYLEVAKGAVDGEADFWGFEEDLDDWGEDLFRVAVEWPLPENLYPWAAPITGTDGLPVGASHWVKGATPVEEIATASEFELMNNYPNPFNPETTIRFSLPANDMVTLKVYDTLGKHVKTLVNHSLKAGHHNLVWDGTNMNGQSVASGIYICQLHAENSGVKQIHKMMLVR